jgi:hypothetical protein
MLERDQTLLAKGRAGVAADRRRRRGIVEADTGGIDIDDDELRRTGEGRGGCQRDGGAGEDQGTGKPA